MMKRTQFSQEQGAQSRGRGEEHTRGDMSMTNDIGEHPDDHRDKDKEEEEEEEEEDLEKEEKDEREEDYSAFEDLGLSGTDTPELFQRGSLNNQSVKIKKIKAPRMTFNSHTKSVLAVTVLQLPDKSPLVISGGEDKHLIVSSLATGNELVSLEGHMQKITGVCTVQCSPQRTTHGSSHTNPTTINNSSKGHNNHGSPSGSSSNTQSGPGKEGAVFLVTCSWDETIRCWPVNCFLTLGPSKKIVTTEEKEEIKRKCLVLKGHRNRVYDLAVLRPKSTDPLIASAAADNSVRIWSVFHTACLHVFTNHAATWNLTIGACYTAEHGPVVIVGCRSSELKVWGLPTGVNSKDYLPVRSSTSNPGTPRRMSRTEAPTSQDPSAIYDFRLIRTITGHPSRITSLCVYNPNTCLNEHGEESIECEGLGQGEIGGYSRGVERSLRTNADVGEDDESDEEVPKTSKKRRFNSGRVSHMNAGAVVVTVCRDLILRLWSIDSGILLKQFHGNTSFIQSAFIQKCPDGEAILLNTSASGNIRVWDLETGELRRMLSGHTDEANGIFSFTSPENNSDLLVVSGSNDCTVRFWTFKEERSLTVLQHNTTQLQKTRVSEVVIYLETDQSKPVFITGCTNGSIYGWSLGDDLEGDLGWVADVHRDQVTSLALYHPHHCLSSLAKSPYHTQARMSSSNSFALLENPLVVSGGRDNVIHVRNLFTGEAVGERLVGHTDAITSVAVYSGGHFRSTAEPIAPFVVSASEDNDIRIWSLENRACLAIIQDHDFDVQCIAIHAPLPSDILEDQPIYQNKGNGSMSASDLRASTETETNDPTNERGGRDKPKEQASHHSRTLLDVNSTEVFTSVDSVSKLPPLIHTFGECKTPITKKRRKHEKKGSHFSPFSPFSNQQGHGHQQSSQYQRKGQSSVASSILPPDDLLIVNEERSSQVLIASCSMDGTVRLYDPYGEVIKVISVEKRFFSFVTVMNSEEYPLLAASTLSGEVFVWSLESPYSCLHVFDDHTDEVRALSLLLTPSRLPVLVSGSWDTTIRVYSLNTFKHMKTIEGQTSEITAIAATSYGGNEPIIASASSDGTVNIYFDFLSSAANKDVVRIAFDFDMRSAKPDHSIAECWPRISNLVEQLGPKSFFVQHYELFFKSIHLDQADFIVKFLHLSHAVLLKTNQSPEGSLLNVAMQYRDVTAVREIIKCWITFLTTIPSDANALIYQDSAMIPKTDLLLLSILYPEEFELLISSLILIPVPNNELRVGTKFLKGEKMYLGEIPAPTVNGNYKGVLDRGRSYLSPRSKKKNAVSPFTALETDEVNSSGGDANASKERMDATAMLGLRAQVMEAAAAGGVRGRIRIDFSKGLSDKVSVEEESKHCRLENKHLKKYKYYFLPLPGLVDVNMLRAYTVTARSLDSFKIFDSIAGKMCQRFVWRVHGRALHVQLFKQYIAYVFFSSLSIYIFPFCVERQKYWVLMGVLLGMQIMYDMYYIYSERSQFLDHPIEYMRDVWNRLDALIIISGLTGNIIRLVTLGDTLISRVSLSIFSICLWFNFLYFLRAFERTGPLVSMIYHIVMDIRALVLVLCLVCVGFSQAFWLLSNKTNAEAYNFQSEYPFSSVKMSFVNSFSYMLGNFESDSFAGLPLENFALVLSCLFMLIVAILLLNLLIALMGDTYGYVSSRGLAQWRLEQLDYVVENSHSKSADVMNLSKYTLYFATLHEEDKNLSSGVGSSGSEDVDVVNNPLNFVAEPRGTALGPGGAKPSSTSQAIAELQTEMHEMKQILMSLQRNSSSRRLEKKTQ